MRGNIISLIGSSCGCSQTEAREYLDSEIRYLRELQEADDLREDDMETACHTYFNTTPDKITVEQAGFLKMEVQSKVFMMEIRL